jgi:hypothetical protein
MLDDNIKNDVNRWATHLTSLGHTKEFISKVVAGIVKRRGPIGNCTCDNWFCTWEYSHRGRCCPGCWALALKCDQMRFVNGVKPVSARMVEESQSWGFDKTKIKELNS